MSKDKFPSIFLHSNGGYLRLSCVKYFLQCARSFENCKISLRYSPVINWGIFSHVMHLVQLHASANI